MKQSKIEKSTKKKREDRKFEEEDKDIRTTIERSLQTRGIRIYNTVVWFDSKTQMVLCWFQFKKKKRKAEGQALEKKKKSKSIKK